MNKVTKFSITFDELFSWTFNHYKPPKDGIIQLEICPLHLVDDGMNKLIDYCNKYGYKNSVKQIKENLVLLTVHLGKKN